ncbi:hypothetical protein J3R83DRAFT_1845 [Lanmaoa asiatica]|nr:hypothetical protein J3R83DRAFT_1845 [Lanmaoa asiatica]
MSTTRHSSRMTRFIAGCVREYLSPWGPPALLHIVAFDLPGISNAYSVTRRAVVRKLIEFGYFNRSLASNVSLQLARPFTSNLEIEGRQILLTNLLQRFIRRAQPTDEWHPRTFRTRRSLPTILAMNAFPVSYQNGTRVFFWTAGGEIKYATVQSTSRLADVNIFP